MVRPGKSIVGGDDAVDAESPGFPSVDLNTAISVDPEMVATPVMPSRTAIPVQEIVYGVDHVSYPSEEKRLIVSWSLPASSRE